MPLMRALLGLSIVVLGCDRGSAPTAAPSPSSSTNPSIASTSNATPSSSGAILPSGPRPLVRLPVAITRASSETNDPGREHFAEHAFDGDPAGGWCAPKPADAWVEAELANPQTLARVRLRAGLGLRLFEDAKSASLHGRVTRVQLVLDGGGTGKELDLPIDAGKGEASLTLPEGTVAKTIRARVLASTKGTKVDDACIAELELWGPAPTIAAPSGKVPKVHGEKLDALLASLSSDHAAAAAFLDDLGFPERARQTAHMATLKSAARTIVQLDADAAAESVVHLAFTQIFGNYRVDRHALAVLDDEANGEVVLGTRWMIMQTAFNEKGDEKGDAGTSELLSFSTHAVHDRAIPDLVIRAVTFDKLTSPADGRDYFDLLTVSRGVLETLASAQLSFHSEAWSKAQSLLVTCTPIPPAPCHLQRGSGGAHTYSDFDAERFVYR